MKKYKLLITDLDGTLIETLSGDTPYFVGFGRQNSITIVRGIMKKIYICIHNRVFIPIRPGWIDGNAKIASKIVLNNFTGYFFVILYQLSSPVKVPISVLTGIVLIPAS